MTSVLLALAVAASVNPAGHWEGSVETPQGNIAFQIDLAGSTGAMVGAITIPSQRLRALPLTTITVDGATLIFGARTDQLLEARVADDGQSMTGTFRLATYAFPFALSRTGDARLTPAPASPRVGAELEGTWRGTLADTGGDLHVVLTVHNDADGFARAEIVNLDEGGLRIPLAIAQTAAAVTFESPAVEGSFAGSLTASGELAGTFRQNGAELSLTFRRTE